MSGNDLNTNIIEKVESNKGQLRTTKHHFISAPILPVIE